MNLLHNPAAMEVLNEAGEKLAKMGLKFMIAPLSLPEGEMSVGLHIAEEQKQLSATFVILTEGYVFAHTNQANFSTSVAEHMTEVVIFNASNPAGQ